MILIPIHTQLIYSIYFNLINDILYLVYSNKKNSITLYNVINNKKIKEIQNDHTGYITNLRYYLDKINKKDLILSISSYNNNIKLWNIDNNNIKKYFLNNSNIIHNSSCIVYSIENI